MAYIIGILLVLVAGLCVAASRQPNRFSVTRTTTINASPETIFPHVNDLQLWGAWSPWARLDPTAKYTFEGLTSGTGAKTSWEGNRKVGAGSMAITDSRPYETIKFRLDFLKPMKASNTAEFTFKPQGSQTLVSWTMSGDNNFMSKLVSLFMNCEKMVGDQFDQGLANLKEVVEKR
jgi:uncharacterized protein YndB with AHSA1/START domain